MVDSRDGLCRWLLDADGVPSSERTDRAEVVTQPQTFAIEAGTDATTLFPNFGGARLEMSSPH